MTLAKYIRKHGAARCAATWGVSVRTVQYWAAEKTKPQRNGTLRRVMHHSKLTFTDIYR